MADFSVFSTCVHCHGLAADPSLVAGGGGSYDTLDVGSLPVGSDGYRLDKELVAAFEVGRRVALHGLEENYNPRVSRGPGGGRASYIP